MNNFKFLLLGTSLSFIPLTVNAQCVATQDCATLGYTETSCNGGKGVKCPFGNKWACFKSDFDVCQKYGFTQTCTGEGQTGVGNACNGKYSECKCNDGYTWDDSLKMCKTNCVIGALYYSDGICLPYKISTKTVIGVVIYEKNTDENGWIMTIEPVKKGIDWGGKANNFPGLDNCTSESCLTDVQSSCINTDIITEYCDKSVCPVAWVAKDYKFGTTSGQNWCLPSGGLLNVSLNNLTNLAKINTGITIAGGKEIGYGTTYDYEHIWSSSVYSNVYAWIFNARRDGTSKISYTHKYYGGTNTSSVRLVMPF